MANTSTVVGRQYASTDCPYCHATLSPLPTALTTCPACHRQVHVRSGPDGLTYLLRDTDIPVLEQAWVETQLDRGWRRAGRTLVDGVGRTNRGSGARWSVLLVLIVSLAVGIMIPVATAGIAGAPFPGTGYGAPVVDSPTPARPTSGTILLAPTPTPARSVTPAPAVEPASTLKPASTPGPSPVLSPSPVPGAGPPSILLRTPGANATGVPAGTSIRIQFSEPVTGVSGTTIQLRNVERRWLVRSAVRYDAATRTAVLNPSLDMYPGTRYRVEILSGVTDSAGSRLAPTRWTFKVASN